MSRFPGDQSAAGDLARMKRIALALLMAAAGLYALAIAMGDRHPAWGYVAAFAEAAMVGAVADWFAVVALFRHPLGLPVPHTAIIPNSKDRIGEKLATFLCANFLSTPQVLAKLRDVDAGRRIARWLADPAHAAQLAAHGCTVLGHSLRTLDTDAVRGFIHDAAVDRLSRIDAAQMLGELLHMLTAHGRHEELLDDALSHVAWLLDDEEIKGRLADVVTLEVKYLRFVGLDAVAGRYASSKLVAGLIQLVTDMGADRGHPLRQRFESFMVQFAERLKTDPELSARGEVLKRELLAHPTLAHYLRGLWDDFLAWTERDLGRPDSILQSRLTRAVQGFGERLGEDAAMREWIDRQLADAAPGLIDRYREDIRGYIVGRVNDWNAIEMTRELERNLGRDLQFIRINGTLVGGLAGLAIHAVTAAVQGL